MPRVLIVNGDPFNNRSATGITMTNLFRGWDPERIAQTYMFDVKPETDICRRYYHLSKSSIPIVALLRNHSSKKLSSSAAAIKTAEAAQGIVSAPSKARIVLKEAADAWADVIPFKLTNEFWQWVEEFKPEVIYTQLVNIRLMDLVLKIANRFSIPVVPHFMDDWPSTRYKNNTFSLLPYYLMQSRIRAVLKKSSRGMTISEMMAREYEQRYGGRFDAFMNCVDIPADPLPQRASEEGSAVIFTYVGGLHLNRWQSLKQVGETLQELKNNGVDVLGEVYAPLADIERYGQIIEMGTVLRIKGSLQPNEVMSVLQSADVLIHIESFDEEDRKYTRLSVSTKIPQYMASGRPILAYGPDDVASCRYIEDQGCGLVVGRRDKELMLQVLESMAKDSGLRNKLGRCGKALALEKHNSLIEREKFRNIIGSVAKNGK